jgi:hypothetical protein
MCERSKQKIREMAINEKIRESITIQSAKHIGGVRIKEKNTQLPII